jgi:hypothetical protein
MAEEALTAGFRGRGPRFWRRSLKGQAQFVRRPVVQLDKELKLRLTEEPVVINRIEVEAEPSYAVAGIDRDGRPVLIRTDDLTPSATVVRDNGMRVTDLRLLRPIR